MRVEQKQGLWSESAQRVLAERYLLKKDGRILETPDEMCARVAAAIARAEEQWAQPGSTTVEDITGEFYRLMVEQKFMPNSPTLMNAGKNNNQQLSACFVLPVGDSIPEIFDAVKHAAVVHQSGGGTGFSFSRLRPKGSTVGSTQGVASGPISFMEIFNKATEEVKQGGSRRGANMGILRVDHPDILDFIECKLSGGITNFNISVAATDTFMKAVETDGEYDLLDPRTQEPVKKLRAREVFDRITEAAWKSGDPGMVFIDRANTSTANPTPEIELLEATNPCGEQWLGPYDACNLGSINLAKFVTSDGTDVDWQALEETTILCTRFLDDVIDVNPYPLKEVREKVQSNRRIGLGIMGWADLLFLLGISYDSEPALALADTVMAFIKRIGHAATEKLATERGPFPNWSRSIYKDSAPRRNSTVTTIAPTGTISIIAECSSGIEPIFALAFQHKVKQPDGSVRTLTFVNPILEQVARARGFYSEEIMQQVLEKGTAHGIRGIPEEVQRVFVTAHEIDPLWHIKMQATWQKHVDNSISKTINLPNSASVKDVETAYLSAYRWGCLGITVFRDGCKGVQVLNVGVPDKETKVDRKSERTQEEHTLPASTSTPLPHAAPELAVIARGTPPTIKPRPSLMHGYTRQVKAPEGTVNITINSDEEGPFEVFINVGKAGSDIAALAESLGRLISLNLRLPSPLTPEQRVREIIGQLRGIGGSRSIGFGVEQVRSLPDAVARTLERHLAEHIAAPAAPPVGVTSGASAPAKLITGNGHSNGNGHGTTPKPIPASAPTIRQTGNLCPTCGSAAFVMEEGCKKCHGCGYSEC